MMFEFTGEDDPLMPSSAPMGLMGSGYDETPESMLWRDVYLLILGKNCNSSTASEEANDAVEFYRNSDLD